MKPPGPLRPLRRFVEILLAWLVMLAASPGVITGDGSMLLAVVGVAWWGAIAARPLGPRRRRARLAEWAACGIGGASLMWWVWYVVPGGLLYIGAGWGLYFLVGGALLRARRGLPLGVAVGLAWLGCETLRTVLAPPLGLGWLQLGHYAHHHLWLSGSARVWGLEGLTLVLAALGGLLAELQVSRRLSRPTLAFAGGAVALGIVFALVSHPPETREGPRVLLVQPGFPQEVKQWDDANENYAALLNLTRSALESRRAAGEPAPDLVSWSETMLYAPLFGNGVKAALARGLHTPPWDEPLTPELVDQFDAFEREQRVQGPLFGIGGGAGILPPGTSFAVGAEIYVVHGDEIRRENALVLYDAEGRRSMPAAKQYLVPGAETMMGLERFEVVRDVVQSLAGYVPDFVPGEKTTVLELATRDGRRFHVGATVCFDNAFLSVYTRATAAGPLDFHLIGSNEAWYRQSCEMDQMVAFSRIAALATGRSVVRATNSGISLVLGPDGRELGRVRKGDRDRSIAGSLSAVVPVPADPDAGAPFYARFRGPLRVLIGIVVAAVWLLPRRKGNPSGEGG